MGLFRFLFKWSLELTGASIIGYNYFLKPQQQAQLYGMYRSGLNSYRTAKQIYAATTQYKSLVEFKQRPTEFQQQLKEVNQNTAKRIQQLSRINKGVYMRLGQYLGHLKYALPSQFTTILKELNAPQKYQPQNYKYLKKHIKNALGKNTKQIFESLNTSPIHTELFYQVYKGQLLENFLDINLRVIHPYASSEAKYDFWFLNKAVNYLNKFKNQHFPNQQPLMLEMILQNVQKNVQQELDFRQEEQTSLAISKKLGERQSILPIKTNKNAKPQRDLPIYIPHRYSQYITEKVAIHQYFEGMHLSSPQEELKKQQYSPRIIASEIVSVWNELLTKQNIILASYRPFDLMVRKSRPNEEGSHQFCLMNFCRTQEVPQIFSKTYKQMWRELIQNKKLNPKKWIQRVNSVEQFYQNVDKILFLKFLSSQEELQKITKKMQLQNFNISHIQNNIVSTLPKEIREKVTQKKIVPANKQKNIIPLSQEDSNALRQLQRAFEIEYQPWQYTIPLETYRQVFPEHKRLMFLGLS